MKIILMVAAVAVSSVLLVPTLAHARSQGEFEQVSVLVRYKPAELATADGAARFQKRVDATIRRICRDDRGLEFREDAQRCVADARQRVRSQVEFAIADARTRSTTRSS